MDLTTEVTPYPISDRNLGAIFLDSVAKPEAHKVGMPSPEECEAALKGAGYTSSDPVYVPPEKSNAGGHYSGKETCGDTGTVCLEGYGDGPPLS